MRTCDGCDACCVLWSIGEPNVTKLAGERCPNLDGDGLCRMYSDRPPTCSSYECLWLRGELPEEYQPALTGVTVDRVLTETGHVIFRCAAARPGALKSDEGKEILDYMLASSAIPVYVVAYRDGPVSGLAWTCAGPNISIEDYKAWRSRVKSRLGFDAPQDPPGFLITVPHVFTPGME